MPSERPQQGDAIAAPIRHWFDQEERVETAQTDFTDRAAWGSSIASVPARLWSRIRRHRGIHRIKAAWETIDGRTIEDIGVSCYEIEFARDARRWRSLSAMD